MYSADFQQYTFSRAAELWLESRPISTAPGTLTDNKNCIKALGRYFGETKLAEIDLWKINEYQAKRSKEVGPWRVNKELSTLGRILALAGTWGRIRPHYRPLSLPDSPGIALDRTEEDDLFRIASIRPLWRVAYCASLLGSCTTAGPGEIRNLQLQDVDLTKRLIHIRRKVKNRYRVRSLWLNDDALWACQTLLKRASEMGATEPQHYLLPHRAARAGEPADPSRPCGSWRKAWEAIRRELGKKHPRLAKLRSYDIQRHTPITRLLEDPHISERTVEEIAGHKINSRTKDLYSHIHMEAKQRAAEVLQQNHIPKPKPPSYMRFARMRPRWMPRIDRGRA